MGFLTILNYIAMGVGYFVLLIVLLLFIWLLISTTKDKMQRKKWEREKAEKEKVEEIVAKENVGSAEKTTAASPATTKTIPPHESTSTAQSTITVQTEKKEEPTKNKENLVDENGKVKMVS